MKIQVFVILIIISATNAPASTFYRCKIEGRTVISNIPCNGEKMETREIQISPSITENQPRQPAIQSQKHKPWTTSTARRSAPKAKEYEVNNRVTERNGVVEISGRLTGPPCDSLRVDAWARTSDGGKATCTTVTRLSGSSTLFNCTDRVRNPRGSRNRDWFISSFYSICQD